MQEARKRASHAASKILLTSLAPQKRQCKADAASSEDKQIDLTRQNFSPYIHAASTFTMYAVNNNIPPGPNGSRYNAMISMVASGGGDVERFIRLYKQVEKETREAIVSAFQHETWIIFNAESDVWDAWYKFPLVLP